MPPRGDYEQPGTHDAASKKAASLCGKDAERLAAMLPRVGRIQINQLIERTEHTGTTTGGPQSSIRLHASHRTRHGIAVAGHGGADVSTDIGQEGEGPCGYSVVSFVLVVVLAIVAILPLLLPLRPPRPAPRQP